MIKRRGYRKPERTGKPGIADAIKPGSIDDLMQRYNQSRTAKKERQTTTMALFEATIPINDVGEVALLNGFLSTLTHYRKDPFAINASSELPISTAPGAPIKSAAAVLFDELVPADDPPEATAGPTWAPHPVVAIVAHPTEDDAVNAFKANVAKRTTDQWKALFATYFGAQRVKDIPAEMRAAFSAEASRDL